MSDDSKERAYRSAVYLRSHVERLTEVTTSDLMNKAVRLEEAAAKFKEVSGFKDADAQAKKCEDAAKEIRGRVSNAGVSAKAAKTKKLIVSAIIILMLALCGIGVIIMFSVISKPQGVETDADGAFIMASEQPKTFDLAAAAGIG